MKILYVASDQKLPGSTGGSVHVHEVSRSLALRGNEVHAVVQDAGETSDEKRAGYAIHRIRWFPQHPFFRMRALGRITDLIDALKPDAIMERYYNFGGEGIRAAAARSVPSLLEVNSPVLDHRGSRKAIVDALLVVRPMRRYRERLCRLASVLISPTRAIVPEFARAKTHEVTWGANVDAFSPTKRDDALRASWGVHAETCVVLFSGSHRPWHGVHVLEEAARRLKGRDDLFFVFAGGDSSSPADFRGVRLGRVPYEAMGRITASSDISVAPYDRAQLKSLELGFFWSPLKIFEAMASGVPVVTLDIEPLNAIVRRGEEAEFFAERDAQDLARVLGDLASSPARRRDMGRRAHERAPRYSWDAHAAQIESILLPLVKTRP